jgi:uncharacterized OB-fold protein
MSVPSKASKRDVATPPFVTLGSRVEAVIEPKSKRTGSINDIRGFRLV